MQPTQETEDLHDRRSVYEVGSHTVKFFQWKHLKIVRVDVNGKTALNVEYGPNLERVLDRAKEVDWERQCKT